MIIHSYTFSGDQCIEGIELLPIGDTHIGSKACDLSLFQKQIDYIKNTPNAYWVGIGDFIDAINYKDTRFDPKEVSPKFTLEDLSDLCMKEANTFIDMVKPIADKCILLAMGNHEYKIYQMTGNDIHSFICGSLKVKNGGWSSMTRLQFYKDKLANEVTTKIMYVSHGWSAARTKGAKVNTMENMLKSFDADIFITGHAHTGIAFKTDTLSLSARCKFYSRKRVFIMIPSTYRTYVENTVTYSERKEFPPSSLDNIKLLIYPFANSRTGDYKLIS